MFVKDETVWLAQKTMGQLFGVESHTITYHLKEIYKTCELDEKATTRKIRVVQTEGKREVARNLDFYNLDCIISVGYRVNSYQATQFRIWATKTLKDYIIKGFVMDDERLKQGGVVFGKDYFGELNQIVSGYLDLAELRAKRQIITNMDEWIILLNDFLKLAQFPILKHQGKVSALEAKLKAEQEFEEYRVKQDKNFISDFDREIKRITGNKNEQ